MFPAPSAADIEATFKAFDKDNSGKISVSELKNAFKELGIPDEEAENVAKVRVVQVSLNRGGLAHRC